jgi:hypothetical protein
MAYENPPKRMLNALSPLMPSNSLKKSLDHEIQLAKAQYALNNKDFSSIRAAAKFFRVYNKILGRRLNGGLTNSIGHEMT